MIIEVLKEKYTCGCKKGQGHLEKPDILEKLNIICEWDHCKFPQKKVGEEEKEVDILDPEGNPTGEKEKRVVPILEEDREFLGPEPELKPGDCFLMEGQVIAVESKDELVLVLSETGPTALERLWKEKWEPEINMLFNFPQPELVEWRIGEENEIPGDYEEGRVEYVYQKIWKDRFARGRLTDSGVLLKCKVTMSDYLLYPITIFLKDWSFLYSPDDAEEEEELIPVVQGILSWFISGYPRKKETE